MAKQPETVVITPHDLPLHCNGPQEQAWNGHPRVFLPIKSFPKSSAPTAAPCIFSTAKPTATTKAPLQAA